jgi:1-acyl-sn-glycerol-3-phosphate acyltransferase
MPNPVSYLAKKELFYHPFIKVMLDWFGAIAVNRESVGLSTIKSVKAVKNTKKWILGLFPQGTREKGNEIHTITKGFVGLAKTTQCNILPIGIVGIDKPKIMPFTGKIIVKIGKIIECSDSQDEILEKWTNSIQELTGFKYIPAAIMPGNA